MSGSLTPEVDAQIQQIDSQIQALRLQEQALDAVQAIKETLPVAREALKGLSDDLKGEGPKLEDVLEFKKGADGSLTPAIKDGAFDALKVDGSKVPARIVNGAKKAQEALEELVNPLAEHKSGLLKSLGKIKDGLDKGSKLTGDVAKGIEQIEKSWTAVERALDGDITDEELLDAFNDYLGATFEIVGDLAGKIPALGAFFEIYGKAVTAITGDVKKLVKIKQQKEQFLADERARALGQDVPSETAADAPPETSVRDSLKEQVEALEQQRLDLMNEAARAEALAAKREIDQLLGTADKNIGGKLGFNAATASEGFINQVLGASYTGEKLGKLPENADPKERAELQEKHEAYQEGTRHYWKQGRQAQEARDEEVLELLRKHPHAFQERDVRELINRLPYLEDRIRDIRAGGDGKPDDVKAGGVSSIQAPAASGASAAKPAKRTGLIAAGVGLLVAVGVGVSTLVGGGSDCPPQSLASGVLASGAVGDVHVAAEEDCPPETPLIGADTTGGETSPPPSASPTEAAPVVAADATEQWLVGEGPVDDDDDEGDDDDDGYDDDDDDGFYSRSDTEAGRFEDRVDVQRVARIVRDIGAEVFAAAFGNTTFPCGRDDDVATVVCPEGATELPGPGEYAFVVTTMDAPIVAGTPGELIYAYVADRDGDPSNDWRTQGGFDWDFFQGTDTWMELIGTDDGSRIAWRLEVSQVTSDQQIVGVTMPVRVVVTGNHIVWVVPASAVPADAPYRVSAFVHDGSYAPAASGGDVPGANPTEPLLQ